MILKMLETGPLQVNCYIVADEHTQEAAVFDPAGNVPEILDSLAADDLKLKYIFNTHAHWDHVGGNQALKQATGAPIVTHPDEAAALPKVSQRAAVWGSAAQNSEADLTVQEGDVVELGRIRFRVIDLKGHSPGGIGFVFEGALDLEGQTQLRRFVICGDALFAGSIGRTDFPGGDLNLLLDNIRTRIFSLPDDTFVLPGHGPASTVGHEKRYNPFF